MTEQGRGLAVLDVPLSFAASAALEKAAAERKRSDSR